jgi:NAD(P)-dependent dehydrogenase (short-subunit alcohol dehydrogenase family)
MAVDDSPVWSITACSTGFGRELATLVLKHGWRATVTARDPKKVTHIVVGHEGRALALPLDVKDTSQITDVLKRTEDAFGRIDVLVNNAGYGYLAAVEEGEDDMVRDIFETTSLAWSRLLVRC